MTVQYQIVFALLYQATFLEKLKDKYRLFASINLSIKVSHAPPMWRVMQDRGTIATLQNVATSANLMFKKT